MCSSGPQVAAHRDTRQAIGPFESARNLPVAGTRELLGALLERAHARPLLGERHLLAPMVWARMETGTVDTRTHAFGTNQGGEAYREPPRVLLARGFGSTGGIAGATRT